MRVVGQWVHHVVLLLLTLICCIGTRSTEIAMHGKGSWIVRTVQEVWFISIVHGAKVRSSWRGRSRHCHIIGGCFIATIRRRRARWQVAVLLLDGCRCADAGHAGIKWASMSCVSAGTRAWILGHQRTWAMATVATSDAKGTMANKPSNQFLGNPREPSSYQCWSLVSTAVECFSMRFDQDVVDLFLHGNRLVVMAHQISCSWLKLKHLFDPKAKLSSRYGCVSWISQHLLN